MERALRPVIAKVMVQFPVKPGIKVLFNREGCLIFNCEDLFHFHNNNHDI